MSLDLLAPLLPVDKGVRLLGVTLSALGTAERASRTLPQLSLALWGCAAAAPLVIDDQYGAPV